MTHINLFDFDGVVGSAFEEALFTMPQHPDDARFIRGASAQYQFKAPGESRQSLRYMLLQRAMWDFGHNIRTGPLFDKIASSEPCMIITARCDLYAVKRMMKFIQFHNLKPTRVFHVGSCEKLITVDMLTQALPDSTFKFYDDNQKHVDGVISLREKRVEAFKVDNDMEDMYEKAIKYYRSEILNRF